MRLQYALYERAEDGYRWTWRATELGDALLDDFVYRIELPNDANSIRPDHLRGGICKFARIVGAAVQEHVVLYRFFDGGSDAGRPNRVVMLAAWTTPDRVSTMPMPYGITAIFRNKMFEYVSERSRKVGIEQPPFGDSLTADDELSSVNSSTIPHQVLVDLIDGFTDEDHDYYLKIRDNEYSLQEKSSAAFDRKEKERESAEKQRQAANHVREKEETLKRKAAEMECKRQRAEEKRLAEGEKRRKQRQWLRGVVKGGLPLVALSLSAVLIAFWTLRPGGLFGIDGNALSPEAEQILRSFKELPLEKQQQLLTQLENWVREQRPRPLPPSQSPHQDEVPMNQQPLNTPPTQTPEGIR